MSEEEIAPDAWAKYLNTGEEPGPPALHAAADQLRMLASKVAAIMIEGQVLAHKLDDEGEGVQSRLVGMMTVRKLKQFDHIELQAIAVQLSSFAAGILREAWGSWDKALSAVHDEGVPLLPGGRVLADNPDPTSVTALEKLLEEPSK